MSEYWDVHCVDCDVGSGLYLNHGSADCARLIEGRAALAAMVGVADHIGIDGERGQVDPTFYATHAGHKLLPRSEYGQFHKQCRKWLDCPTCSHRHNCGRLVDHDGPCDFASEEGASQ